jgi:hypothetical protein
MSASSPDAAWINSQGVVLPPGHFPPLHVPLAQQVSQAPQFLGLVLRSVHVPSQAVRPRPQFAKHCPCWQFWVTEQTSPHRPQLAGSSTRSTHAPTQQTSCPPPHDMPFATVMPPVQAPLRQASPVVQGSPSLQVVPSGAAGLEQSPVVVSQVPAT